MLLDKFKISYYNRVKYKVFSSNRYQAVNVKWSNHECGIMYANYKL